MSLASVLRQSDFDFFIDSTERCFFQTRRGLGALGRRRCIAENILEGVLWVVVVVDDTDDRRDIGDGVRECRVRAGEILDHKQRCESGKDRFSFPLEVDDRSLVSIET